MGEAVKVKRQERHFKHMQTWTFLDPALNRPIKKFFWNNQGNHLINIKLLLVNIKELSFIPLDMGYDKGILVKIH